MNKKGNAFAGIASLATSVALVAIILIFTFLFMSQGREQIGQTEGFDGSNSSSCDTSLSCNATRVLQTSVDDFPTWMPLIIIVGIGVVLIGAIAGLAKMRS